MGQGRNGSRLRSGDGRASGTTTYEYTYNGSSLSQMTVDGNILRFAYDANGLPMSVTYNGTTYYYITNVQGDIIAILDTTGNTVVTYTYDAWGNILTLTGSLSSTLGSRNPLRYRGYVYDTETGFYYLQSRYYDPEVGRFLNADSYASTGQGLLGNNMFAYCRNNPVCRVDISGRYDVELFDEDGNPFNDHGNLNGNGGGGGSNNTSGGTGSGTGASSGSTSYPSMRAFKTANGSAGAGKHWHHIVEQCQINKSGFPAEQIYSDHNTIALDANAHARISGYYSSTRFDFTNGMRVRDWLAGQSFEFQYQFGLNVMTEVAIK